MAVAVAQTEVGQEAELAQLVAEVQAKGPHGWLLRGEPPPMPRGAEELGAWYDAAAADKAVAFFPKYLRHVEGEWAGRPFVLDPWEEAVVRQIFGWKLPDGRRLLRTVYIEIARKNGKTSFAAGLAILLLIGDREYGGQGYVMAVDEGQAKILFTKAAQMVAGSPALSGALEVFKPSIFCPELQASFKPLGRGAANKHGFSPSFALGDELHEWPDGEQADVVHKGMGARRQPLEVFITTAGVRNRGYGWEVHQYAGQVLKGEVIDPSFLPVVYAADPDEDWTSDRALCAANPNLDRSVKLEFLRGERVKAQRTPRQENDYRRFHLNHWVEQASRWLPMKAWAKCTAWPHDPDAWRRLEAQLIGRPCFAGMDIGAVRDLSAWVLIFPPQAPGERTVLLPRFWVPGASVEDRVARFLVPYDAWARMGALTITEGNATDFGTLKRQILEDCSRFEVKGAGFDPHNAQQLQQELENEGVHSVRVFQQFGSLGSATRELERLVVEETLLEHGNHPVLTWMASNAVVRTDPQGNIKPDKKRAVEKIDGIVAAVTGMALMCAQQVEAPSYTATHGVMVV